MSFERYQWFGLYIYFENPNSYQDLKGIQFALINDKHFDITKIKKNLPKFPVRVLKFEMKMKAERATLIRKKMFL